MREIKFRAWYARGGQRAKGIMIYVDPNGGYGKVKDNAELFRLSTINIYELMQYTGLKDKNGKDVYEGDIVTDPAINGRQIVFYCTEHPAFELGRRGSDTQIDKHNKLYRDYVEVIGNIYENPQLLNTPTESSKEAE